MLRPVKLHPKQIAWTRAMRGRTNGGLRILRKGPLGCYGSCCGFQARGTRLCTFCRRTMANRSICCGYYTVRVGPRIEVPPAQAEYRWKEFIKRFPHFRHRETLKYIPGQEPPHDEIR